jgi:hypothetical protein
VTALKQKVKDENTQSSPNQGKKKQILKRFDLAITLITRSLIDISFPPIGSVPYAVYGCNLILRIYTATTHFN